MTKLERRQAKQAARLLKFLSTAGQVRITDFGPTEEGRLLLAQPEKPESKMLSTNDLIAANLTAGLIEISQGWCSLTKAGIAKLKRYQAAAATAATATTATTAMANGTVAEFQAQHQRIVEQQILIGGERQQILRNLDESPLSRLRNRKGRDGQPWLSESQFSAGERLRADFTRAQLANSITSNWRCPSQIRTAAGGGGIGGRYELSDSAIDARQRFHQALDFVGSDLAHVLTDVCCFLKGLQSVERERQWPPRSAKLMLRTGLQLLTRYYGTEAGQFDRTARPGAHLGASDPKPGTGRPRQLP